MDRCGETTSEVAPSSLRTKYSAFATASYAVGAPLLQMRHFYCRCFGTLLKCGHKKSAALNGGFDKRRRA